MKFLIDAHLSPSLAEVFENSDVIHTSSLPNGNLTSDTMKNYFEKNAKNIIRLLEDHSFLILEIENIRVLD